MDKLSDKAWWSYLGEDLQELLHASFLLAQKAGDWDYTFHDYSFVVFPASKAFEGFLKKLFLDLGFISENEYFGNRFRIGKALNPSLEKELRKKESVYDRLAEFCGDKNLADTLWLTWKNCRNLIFHWFPNEVKAISLGEARQKTEQIVKAIDTAFKECRINKEPNE